MNYIVSAEAAADLEEIGDYIAQDNPQRAVTFVDEIRARFESISRVPWRTPPDQRSIPACGRAFTGHYVICYYVSDTTVEIARVLHGARNIARFFQS